MDKKRWEKLSFVEQMANIASEIARAIKWKEANEQETSQQCFWRAVELIDLTIESCHKKTHLKEICRLKEVFCDYFLETNNYQTKPSFINDYLLPFAILEN